MKNIWCHRCGKSVFITFRDAEHFADRHRNKPRYRKPGYLHAYPCPHGMGYHIGHERGVRER